MSMTKEVSGVAGDPDNNPVPPSDAGFLRETSRPKVAILLCTYQGQAYLADQLDSFAAQTHQNWEVWASDDGSRDQTPRILADYRSRWGAERLKLCSGPAKGVVANFMSLVARSDIQADFFAFSDQDDIWHADKLARALAWMAEAPPDTPALYCSRTHYVDASDRSLGLSPLFRKPPGFANAVVQSLGGGNTMVFNRAARDLLSKTDLAAPCVMHDWWAYIVVSGCGGKIYYDDSPTLRYRQHEDNQIGMNSSWTARLKRVSMLWEGRFRSWNDQNISALSSFRSMLTPENALALRNFEQARRSGLLRRLVLFKKSGIYRQTFLGNVGLIVAAFLGRI